MAKTPAALKGSRKTDKKDAKAAKRTARKEARKKYFDEIRDGKHSGAVIGSIVGLSFLLAGFVVGHAVGVPQTRKHLDGDFAEIKETVEASVNEINTSNTYKLWAPERTAETSSEEEALSDINIDEISDEDLQKYPEGTQANIADYRAKQARVEEIQTRVKGIQTELNALEKAKDEGYTNADKAILRTSSLLHRRQINAKASKLNIELDDLKSELSSLNTEMGELYSNIQSDIKQLGDLQAENGKLQGELDRIENMKFEPSAANVDEIKSWIGNVGGKIGEIAGYGIDNNGRFTIGFHSKVSGCDAITYMSFSVPEVGKYATQEEFNNAYMLALKTQAESTKASEQAQVKTAIDATQIASYYNLSGTTADVINEAGSIMVGNRQKALNNQNLDAITDAIINEEVVTIYSNADIDEASKIYISISESRVNGMAVLDVKTVSLALNGTIEVNEAGASPTGSYKTDAEKLAAAVTAIAGDSVMGQARQAVEAKLAAQTKNKDAEAE